MYKPIPTYVINLKHRVDRREHITKEFIGKPEFAVELIEACEHTIGAVGLWQSICRIIESADQSGKEFVLICEDDHQFTAAYSKEYLFDCIAECIQEKGDVLLGAISWFDSALPVSDNLYWVGRFTGTQFMIIFRKFYKSMLKASFADGDNADHKIAAITRHKFLLSRPISVQAYFGYSDITARNGLEGRLDELFDRSEKGIQLLNTVSHYYTTDLQKISDADAITDFTNITLPVYVIMPPDSSKESIEQQFAGKNEFDLHFIETGTGNVAIWKGIRSIIEDATKNDDDIIIICDKDHLFTAHYSKEYLFSNIIGAHYQGADLLVAGCRNFYRAFPIAPLRYWIAGCNSATFLVIYRKFFETVMAEPFNEEVKPGELIIEITFNKMLLYPFISIGKDGANTFEDTMNKLAEVEAASAKYYWKAQL
jgi:GGDEF domain-containing protein